MVDSTTTIVSSRTLTLDLPPSCIEFCPAHPAYFVVGTYNLQKEDGQEPSDDAADDGSKGDDMAVKKQNRDGSLIVFQLDNSEIVKTQTVEYPSAILDLHFHAGHPEVLAVVSSTGMLSFFRLTESGCLTEIITHSPLGPSDGVLFLSCAWHPTFHELLAITTSDFNVHIFRIGSDWTVHPTSEEPAASHQLEAWTVAFLPSIVGAVASNRAQEVTVLSGGDDSKLLASTLTYSPSETHEDATNCIEKLYPARGFKGHDAGVTAILPLAARLDNQSLIILTGSYDDHIRIFSFAGPFQAPICLAEKNLGGGVWRLKTVGATKTDGNMWEAVLLASCMHAGARLLRVAGDQGRGECVIEILGRFEEHKSMNYGSDYAPRTDKVDRPLQCVSTSFYDKLLCLWEFTT